MSKPSVGYKNIPLLWIDMMDVSKIIGFILPDWIADVLLENTQFILMMELLNKILKEMF